MLEEGALFWSVRGRRRLVDVRLITLDGVQRHTPQEIPALLDGAGLVWIDVQY